MRVRCRDGVVREAELSTESSASSYGFPVLLIEGEPAGQGPSDLVGIRLVRATAAELFALKAAGYSELVDGIRGREIVAAEEAARDEEDHSDLALEAAEIWCESREGTMRIKLHVYVNQPQLDAIRQRSGMEPTRALVEGYLRAWAEELLTQLTREAIQLRTGNGGEGARHE